MSKKFKSMGGINPTMERFDRELSLTEVAERAIQREKRKINKEKLKKKKIRKAGQPIKTPKSVPHHGRRKHNKSLVAKKNEQPKEEKKTLGVF